MSAKRVAHRDDEREGTVAFEVTKPVDLTLLDKELAEAEGWDTACGLTADGVLSEGSDAEPLTIWVHNPEVNPSTFRKVVTSHAGPKETP